MIFVSRWSECYVLAFALFTVLLERCQGHLRMNTLSRSKSGNIDPCSSVFGEFCHRKLRDTNKNIEIIENAYLIKLKPSTNGVEFLSMITSLLTFCKTAKLHYIYHLSLNAFALTNVSSVDLKIILDDPDVLYAERDGVIKGFAVQNQLDVERWGLDRIDQHQRVACNSSIIQSSTLTTWDGLSENYRYDKTGRGVKAFVIDSGIQSNHREFVATNQKGVVVTRVSCGFNSRRDLNESCEDEWGHGTHVSSILGGNTFGVAKEIQLIAVKIFGADGSSRFADVIAGIEYVMEQKKENPRQPMLMNLSLGTSHIAKMFNDAVNEAVRYGIPVIAASGNAGVDACSFSPASASQAIVVGASTMDDYIFINSNWGRCVDIFAPGALVRGAWIGHTNNNEKVLSGTSMAAPYVSGVIALYMEQDPTANVVSIRNRLISDATRDVLTKDINDVCGDQKIYSSPNLLLNVQALFSSPSPSVNPSTHPTFVPSDSPTHIPTIAPTPAPSLQPSVSPTNVPSVLPTQAPTTPPTSLPSKVPSSSPSQEPSITPSLSPSQEPSITPSSEPSISPSLLPTFIPSIFPSKLPSYSPTSSPSYYPTTYPSRLPSARPSTFTEIELLALMNRLAKWGLDKKNPNQRNNTLRS